MDYDVAFQAQSIMSYVIKQTLGSGLAYYLLPVNIR